MSEKTKEIRRFLGVVHELRRLCPWDRKQTHQTLAKYLIEEAYETIDAIESGDSGALEEELGDLLLQVVLHSEIASEKKQFDFESVSKGIADKMIRRHPHVFGAKRFKNYKQHLKNWTRFKSEEKKGRGLLDGIPRSLPSLQRAYRYGEIAASVGFDWKDAKGAFQKVEEEVLELKAEIKKGKKKRIEEELGDLFFALSSFARHMGIDSERAARRSAEKFQRRFAKMESHFKKKKKSLSDCSFDELDAAWELVKR